MRNWRNFYGCTIFEMELEIWAWNISAWAGSLNCRKQLTRKAGMNAACVWIVIWRQTMFSALFSWLYIFVALLIICFQRAAAICSVTAFTYCEYPMTDWCILTISLQRLAWCGGQICLRLRSNSAEADSENWLFARDLFLFRWHWCHMFEMQQWSKE